MSEKLKPCPFCGGEAEINYETMVDNRKIYWAQIICKQCHARSVGNWNNSYKRAGRKEIDAWNTRKPMEQIVEQLEEKLEQEILAENIVSDIGTGLSMAIAIVEAGGMTMENRYLFRAKRIDTGEWHIGNLVDYPDGRNKIAEVGGNWALHEVDPSTICQCTGLKDKNGNMVFENDIMVGYLDGIFQDNATYVMVIWHNNGFCTHQIHCDDYELIDEFDQNHFTVCGNIFDNPELQEQE